MMWTTRGSHLLLQDPEPFDLNETLDCGQAFRWERLPDGPVPGSGPGAVSRPWVAAGGAAAGKHPGWGRRPLGGLL